MVITSHWEMGRRGSTNFIRIEDPKYSYLVGRNEQGEGYFIIWNNGGPVGQLDRDSYRLVLKDAEKAELKPPIMSMRAMKFISRETCSSGKSPIKSLRISG